jgi:hypothetical protein
MDRDEIRVDPAALREFATELTAIVNDVLLPGLGRQRFLFTDPVAFGKRNPSGELYQRRVETAQAIRDAHGNLASQIAALRFLIEAIQKMADGYQASDALSAQALQRVLRKSGGVVPGIPSGGSASVAPADAQPFATEPGVTHADASPASTEDAAAPASVTSAPDSGVSPPAPAAAPMQVGTVPAGVQNSNTPSAAAMAIVAGASIAGAAVAGAIIGGGDKDDSESEAAASVAESTASAADSAAAEMATDDADADAAADDADSPDDSSDDASGDDHDGDADDSSDDDSDDDSDDAEGGAA